MFIKAKEANWMRGLLGSIICTDGDTKWFIY